MVQFYPERSVSAPVRRVEPPAAESLPQSGRSSGRPRRRFLPTTWFPASLICTFFWILIPAGYADADLSDDLVLATEQEGRAVARALHEYHLKQIEIDDKGIDLNDGTMLGGRYRYDLNEIGSRADGAFAQLLKRVQTVTGTREGSRDKAELISIHWRREMYGFGTSEELAGQLSTRRTISWLTVACVCLVPGSIPRRIRKPEGNQTPLEVPEDLTTVEVPGMRYRVNLVTGLVMDKEMWDEIKTTTTLVEGTFGNRTSEVRTESVRKGKAYLLTQDGKEDILKLTGHGHDYRPGNVVTFIFYGRGKKRNAICAYNHATERTEEMIGLDQAHGSLWMLNLAVTGVVAYLAFDWASSPMQRPGVDHGGWILFKSAGVALIFTTVVHFLNRWRRHLRFRRRYEPRIRKFLQEGNDGIQKVFRDLIDRASS